VLLAVDVGNTQTHLGAFEGQRLVEHWRFQTRAGATGDELAERIGGLLALREMALADLDAVCVSSVVPPLGAQYEQLTERYLDAECLLIAPGVRTGMPIRIDNPLEVGADRLVNAVAAYELVRGACVVVDFGTGINFDAVSAAGEYLGGAIAPGLEISLTALVERAARIPRIDLAEPEAAIGRSSRAAIQSGVVFGFAGLIDGVVRRIEEELGGARFLATGGLAAAIVPFTETIDEVDDLLTLKGLRLIHDRNK
jgi:type III pantothenate kinase